MLRPELVDPMASTTARPAPAKTASGVSWLKLGIGIGAIAAGLATDLLPDSASNYDFDALDLAPLALYGVGAGFLYSSVF